MCYEGPSQVNTKECDKFELFCNLSSDLSKPKVHHAWCNRKKTWTFSNCTKKEVYSMIMILADHTISLPKHPQWSKWPYAIKAKFSLYNSRCSTCKPSPTASDSVIRISLHWHQMTSLQDVPTAIHLQQQVVLWCDPISSLIISTGSAISPNFSIRNLTNFLKNFHDFNKFKRKIIVHKQA